MASALLSLKGGTLSRALLVYDTDLTELRGFVAPERQAEFDKLVDRRLNTPERVLADTYTGADVLMRWTEEHRQPKTESMTVDDLFGLIDRKSVV
jgi:hypothetical protein